MELNAFKKLLDKKLTGSITVEENELLERFEYHFENKTQVFESDEDRKRVKAKIFKSIELKPKNQKSNDAWRIAASIAIIFGISASIWFGVDQFSEPELLSFKTESGQQSEIELSDGTKVILNGSSILSYPESFDADHRQVSIQGEAWFHVAKDESRPFLVITQGVSTTVLGTQFTVKSYQSDSSVSVSLLEGSVRVEGIGQSKIIKPGVSASFDLKDQLVTFSEFDSLDVISWMSQSVVFKETPFDEIALTMHRQFGIQIKWSDSELSDFTMSGQFENAQAETILSAMAALKGLEYKMENDSTATFSKP